MTSALSKFQKIKKIIKVALERLPFEFGLKVVAPLARWFLAEFIYRKTITRLQRMRYAKSEAIKIRSSIAGGLTHVTIIYDNLASPPTIGDFINVVMIGRYFLSKNVSIKFYIINGEYRSDWCAFTQAEKNIFVDFQIDLVKKFIPISEIEVTIINWEDCLKIIQRNTLAADLVFLRDRVASREGIYGDCFNILNFLLLLESHSTLDKFLLKSTDFSTYISENKSPPNNYVSWHVRYNNLWGQERNLSIDQFEYYLDRISKLHSGKDIILVSDSVGCDYYKGLLKRININANIGFSKDLNNDFYGDCFVILNSDFYYQLRGGGIGMVAIYSNLPYEIVDPCDNEIAWLNPRFSSWAGVNQKRYSSINEI